MMLAPFLAFLMTAASPDAAALIARSEQGMYAADFTRAAGPLDAALAAESLDPDMRLALLLQKLRVQQNARLAGVTLGDEKAVMDQVTALAATTKRRDLAGQAKLRIAVSRYFTQLLAGDTAGAMAFVPEFRAAAAQIDARCRRAEALFFAGLMPQVAGQVALSKDDLAAAETVAADVCPLESSYVDRHKAYVAEDAGDLRGALALATRSSEVRRRIGFEIFLPFSMLLEADLAAKTGDSARADKLAAGATAMAARLRLPAALRSACEVLKARATSSPHCAGTAG